MVSGVNSAGEQSSKAPVARAGRALQRSPYAWLAVAILLFIAMLGPVGTTVDDRENASFALAVAASAWIVVTTALAILTFPRFIYPLLEAERGGDHVAVLRWTLAISPFLVGVSAVIAGAEQWCLSIGFAASLALLIQAARSMARQSPANA
jgi:hypothetical protein